MNESWFSKNLGDAMLAGVYMDDLEKSFQLEYTKSNSPKDMALFKRHESEGRLHCEVVAYFSRTSASFARDIGAKPCIRPTPYDLSLEIGSEECWPLLFPNINNDK